MMTALLLINLIPIFLLGNKGFKTTYFTNTILILSAALLYMLKSMYTMMPKMNIMTSTFMYDLMSSTLSILTIYLVILCYIVSAPTVMTSPKVVSYSFILWVLLISLVLCFLFKNLFWFYISFEFALIPTILLIIGWGYQEERFQAAFYLMMFTITTSLPMLMVVMLYSHHALPSFIPYYPNMMFNWPHKSLETLTWMALTTVFMVKLPIYLFHLWLPKAHVEAPVVGSMLLAGVLLKLGGYGFMRFGTLFMSKMPLLMNLMVTISICGALLTAMICTTQIDMKALIAYSSIAHMSLMMIAMVSSSSWGWQSALTIMISHGLCSSGLFSAAGIIYDFTHTRNLLLNKGMLVIFPSMMLPLFLLSVCNFGAPPSMNMMGEIMALTASVSFSYTLTIGLIILLMLCGWYSMSLYMTISHGQLPKTINPMNMPTSRIYTTLLAHLIPLIFYLMNPALFCTW